jgi:hypothetical protein
MPYDDQKPKPLDQSPTGAGTSDTVLPPEKFYSIKKAAELLGLHYWVLQRAIRRGLVPYHQLLTNKKLVRLSEVISVMERARHSGEKITTSADIAEVSPCGAKR